MRQINAAEIEKRLRTWADLTLLSLELKRAALKKKYPSLGEQEARPMSIPSRCSFRKE